MTTKEKAIADKKNCGSLDALLTLVMLFDAVPNGIIVTHWTKRNGDALVSAKIHLNSF